MSSSVSDLLLQVASEQRDHSCVAALASGLTPLELAELLDELRAAGRHSQQHVFALCRLLLSLERTREDAIITCVKLFHDQRIRDKAGLSCLSEVRAAIVQRASASDDPQAAVATVAFLQRVCDAILSFLSDGALADKSAAQVSGHIQALELLPTVLDCADSALHLPGGRGVWQQLEDVRTSTVRRVLETRWPAPLLLPLFTALSEVELKHEERHVVYSKVEDGLIAEDAAAASASRVDLNSSVVGLIQVATWSRSCPAAAAWPCICLSRFLAVSLSLARSQFPSIRLSLPIFVISYVLSPSALSHAHADNHNRCR